MSKGMLVLDSKIIELSEETTNNLMKDLGIPQPKKTYPWLVLNYSLGGDVVDRIIVRISQGILASLNKCAPKEGNFAFSINPHDNRFGTILSVEEMTISYIGRNEVIL